jgi:hypothetical protein
MNLIIQSNNNRFPFLKLARKMMNKSRSFILNNTCLFEKKMISI